MKDIERLFLFGAGYTTLILSIYYAFAAITTGTTTVSVGRFFLILLFGFIIAGAEFAYKTFNFKRVLKCLVHYCILLLAFCLIFILGGFFEANSPSAVFAAVIIFTAFYFLLFAVVYFVRKGIARSDEALESRRKKNSVVSKATKKQEEEYTPRYQSYGDDI